VCFSTHCDSYYSYRISNLCHHHQLSSSASEGRHAARVQDLHRFLFSAVQICPSNHIRLGFPCADLLSSFPSSIWSASLPLEDSTSTGERESRPFREEPETSVPILSMALALYFFGYPCTLHCRHANPHS